MKKSNGAADNVSRNFQVEADARALAHAQKVRTDSKRHFAALNHMKKRQTDIQSTVDREEKAKKGLAAAFPPDKTCATCGKKSCRGCGGK